VHDTYIIDFQYWQWILEHSYKLIEIFSIIFHDSFLIFSQFHSCKASAALFFWLKQMKMALYLVLISIVLNWLIERIYRKVRLQLCCLWWIYVLVAFTIQLHYSQQALRHSNFSVIIVLRCVCAGHCLHCFKTYKSDVVAGWIIHLDETA